MSTRAIGLIAIVAVGCACGEPAAAPAAEDALVSDAGAPMIPIAPRDERKYEAPPCDPAWRPYAPTPVGTEVGLSGIMATSDGQLVGIGRGLAAVVVDGEWVTASLPEIVLSSDRRVVFWDAASFEGDVYVVGSRLTVLRFDGTEWHLAYQDRSVGPRRGFLGQLSVCDGALTAQSGVSAVREAGGTWRRVDRRDASCGDGFRPTPRPDERCGNHTPWDHVVRCAAGWRLWAARRERWLPLPAALHGVRYLRPSSYDDGSRVYVVTDEGPLFETTDDGMSWQTVELREDGDAEPIRAVVGGGTRVYAASTETVYVRDVCE